MSLCGIAFAPARSRSFSHSSHARPVARSTASLPTPARRSSATPRPAGRAWLFGRRAMALRTAGLRAAVGRRAAVLRLLAGRAFVLRLVAIAASCVCKGYWLPAAFLQEDELLEQMHVLLVLEQRPIERRNRGLVPRSTQRLGRNVLGQQQLQPIQQLRGRGLLLQAGHLADLEEHLEGGLQQALLDVRTRHVYAGMHR